MSEQTRHEYLGDGVYASFDGYHVWIHVGSHETPPCVALAPEVLESLFRYALRRGAALDGMANETTAKVAAESEASALRDGLHLVTNADKRVLDAMASRTRQWLLDTIDHFGPENAPAEVAELARRGEKV